MSLLRANSTGAATIPLVKEDVSGLFTVPTNVEFADGAYEAAIKVSFDRTKLTVGEDYSIKLNVPENPIQGKIRTFTLTINRIGNFLQLELLHPDYLVRGHKNYIKRKDLTNINFRNYLPKVMITNFLLQRMVVFHCLVD